MKKIFYIFLSFVFLFSACGLKQEKKEPETKKEYATNGKQPKNIDEAIYNLGYKVSFTNRFEWAGKRDFWEITHIDEEEQTKWTAIKEGGKHVYGIGDMLYYGYMYGDEPLKMFFGEDGELGQGVLGVAAEEIVNGGVNKVFKFGKGVINEKDAYYAYGFMKGTEKGNDLIDAYKKIDSAQKIMGKFLEDGSSKDLISMEGMHILTYGLLNKKEKPLNAYEWAFSKANYQNADLFQVNFPTNNYPVNANEDEVMLKLYADTLRMYNGSELPKYDYKNSPELILKTDESSRQGKGAKMMLQFLLYDIHQVLTGKPTAYFGEYAYHLIEDYDRTMTHFETELYASHGFTLLQMEKYKEADELFRKSLKLKSDHIASLLGKAKIQLHEGEDKKAIATYQKVLTLMNDKEMKKELSLEEVVEQYVNSPQEYVLIDIIKTLHENEKYEEIVRNFSSTVNEKTHAVLSYYYGDALAKNGDCEKGMYYIQKAKKEVEESITNADIKDIARETINQTLQELETKTCQKKSPKEVVLTFEVGKDGTVKTNIPKGEPLVIRPTQVLKIYEKKKDNERTLRVMFPGDILKPDAVPSEGRVVLPIDHYTARPIKEGTGEISILPDADWEKAYKIQVQIR